MIDPLPDARLRDDVAQQIFTQVMDEAQGLEDLGTNDRRALLAGAAAICFEAAEAFVQARRVADRNRRT